MTESWLHPQISIHSLDIDSKYNIVRRDRDSHGGGVCLLVANNIKCVPVSIDLDLPGCGLVCVDIVTRDGTLRLAVCYRSTPLSNQSLAVNCELIYCLDKLCKVKYTCCLMGCFNLLRVDWCSNSVKSDAIKKHFMNILQCRADRACYLPN